MLWLFLSATPTERVSPIPETRVTPIPETPSQSEADKSGSSDEKVKLEPQDSGLHKMDPSALANRMSAQSKGQLEPQGSELDVMDQSALGTGGQRMSALSKLHVGADLGMCFFKIFPDADTRLAITKLLENCSKAVGCDHKCQVKAVGGSAQGSGGPGHVTPGYKIFAGVMEKKPKITEAQGMKGVTPDVIASAYRRSKGVQKSEFVPFLVCEIKGGVRGLGNQFEHDQLFTQVVGILREQDAVFGCVMCQRGASLYKFEIKRKLPVSDGAKLPKHHLMVNIVGKYDFTKKFPLNVQHFVHDMGVLIKERCLVEPH